jgi:hypothetical protein
MSEASDTPIYIIGTERSGSNLLRVILNAHSRIDVPHPPHILKYFSSLEHRYGDLDIDANMSRLVRDICRLLDVHIYPWELKLDVARVVAEARPRSLFGAFAAIQNQHLEQSEKARWGNKSTFMIHHVDAILERDPEARLVWLVRDVRDVAVSSRKSVFSPCHPAHTARLWTEQQSEGLSLQERLDSRHLLRMHYEDLLEDPERELRRLCDFLGEKFEAQLLNHASTGAARKGAGLSESWENTGRPILRGNSGKWRKGLTRVELESVESEAGELMKRLGYAVETEPREFSWVRRRVFAVQNWIWSMGVEWRSLRKDKNHWRRWKRALLLDWLWMTARPAKKSS